MLFRYPVVAQLSPDDGGYPHGGTRRGTRGGPLTPIQRWLSPERDSVDLRHFQPGGHAVSGRAV